MQNYRWAVRRNGLLLIYTLTQAKAQRIAAQYVGAVVMREARI